MLTPLATICQFIFKKTIIKENTMIWDTIDHLTLYRSSLLGPAIDWLSSQLVIGGFTSILPEGTHKIKDEDLFVLVQKYDTKDSAKAMWESHKRYIDIQVLLHGEETVEVANILQLTQTSSYDESTDKFRYEGPGNCMVFKTGQFAVFFPWDAHRCSMHTTAPQQVLKYCVKLRYK